jgi:LEA14-like dessication related protein
MKNMVDEDDATVLSTVVASDCADIEVWVYLEGAVIDPEGTSTYSLPMRTDLNNLKYCLVKHLKMYLQVSIIPLRVSHTVMHHGSMMVMKAAISIQKVILRR